LSANQNPTRSYIYALYQSNILIETVDKNTYEAATAYKHLIICTFLLSGRELTFDGSHSRGCNNSL